MSLENNFYVIQLNYKLYVLNAMITYDINRPWLSLDQWQHDYINADANQSCFLLCARQCGKTTAMSIKSVELCMHHFKKGEYILICSITEKQAYHMLAKALAYAKEKYPREILSGKDKPTMHKINFRNGTGIFCYAAGETGEGLRGYTIKKLMIDEGSRMSEEFFIAVTPMLSITKGSMDIGSTPFGKKHKDGTLKFFYKCSMDDKFLKFYISASDCPRHEAIFLEQEKTRLSKLAYAQEYEAVFTDELLRLFDDALINRVCCLKRDAMHTARGRIYIGVDVAGLGKDTSAYAVLCVTQDKSIIQLESMEEKGNMTTATTRSIIRLDNQFNAHKIGVDDGGIGFGVFSELMNIDSSKRKTIALNNSSRVRDKEEHNIKLLKEEMYMQLLVCMEQDTIRLLDDDSIKASLSSIQYEDNKIFGSDSHLTEAIIRACWLANTNKMNVFIHTF